MTYPRHGLHSLYCTNTTIQKPTPLSCELSRSQLYHFHQLFWLQPTHLTLPKNFLTSFTQSHLTQVKYQYFYCSFAQFPVPNKIRSEHTSVSSSHLLHIELSRTTQWHYLADRNSLMRGLASFSGSYANLS